jgi:hypothetical protein
MSPMPRTLILTLLLASTAQAGDVKAVLKKLGEDAIARENNAPCTYKETTTVEELSREKDSKVLGSEVRLFDVEVKGTEVTRRDVVSVTKSGEPLADLLEQPRDTKGKKPARSPLHPESQVDYRFELKDGPSPEEQTLTIEPIKPNTERVRGEAVVDAKTMQLKTLQFSPSKTPMLLKSFAMRFEFADTACGRQPLMVSLEGEGVAVFVETKFRSKTVLSGHARPAPAAAATKKKK